MKKGVLIRNLIVREPGFQGKQGFHKKTFCVPVPDQMHDWRHVSSIATQWFRKAPKYRSI
jgi:hypothetical protein